MTKCFRLITIISLAALFLCGCIPQTAVVEQPAFSVFAELTHMYELNALRDFFTAAHLNRPTVDISTEEFLERLTFYEEVNERFPVEVLRVADTYVPYTVYRVAEGGYYYVFWSYAFPSAQSDEWRENPEALKKTSRMCVLFSVYVGQPYSKIDYYEIVPGITTMAEVMALDPYIEYVNLSRGAFTCSVLDPSTILQIQYYYAGDDTNEKNFYDAMVVKEVTIVKISDSVSLLGYVLSEDLAAGQGDGSPVPSETDPIGPK